MFSGIDSYNTCSNAIILTIVSSLVYCPVDDTLFEVIHSFIHSFTINQST